MISRTIYNCLFTGPVVESVQPRGDTGVTTQITITGQNFGNGSTQLPTVKVGENDCTSVQWESSSEIRCNVEHGIGHSFAVVVTLDSQQSNRDVTYSYNGTILVQYIEFVLIFYIAPTISSISPSTTSTRGGRIIVTGSNLVPSSVSPCTMFYLLVLSFFANIITVKSNVTVDGKLCESPSWINEGEVSCDFKEGTGTNKEVIVIVGDQKSGSIAHSYTGNY